jgi:CRISPR-associated protein Cas2
MSRSGQIEYFVIIAYDIVDNRRRARVHKFLKGMGFPVQKSVFECRLLQEQIDRIYTRLLVEVDGDEDTVRIYRLPFELHRQMDIIGTGEIMRDEQMVLI